MKRLPFILLLLTFAFVNDGVCQNVSSTNEKFNEDVSFMNDCDLFEDLEDINPSNPGYAGSIVTSPSGTWLILGYGTMDANDRYLDAKSIRLRANNSDPANNAMTIPGEGTTGANVVQMEFDKPNGVGTVSFYYGSYSGHSGGELFVEYSTDGGITWNPTANNSVTAPAWTGEMLEFTVNVDIPGNVRIRIIKYKQSGTQNSVNVDNICVSDYMETNTVAAPTFTPPGGNYLEQQSVTINCATAGATIHYTTDGSTPTTSSPVYSTPVTVSTTTTLKAIAVKAGMDNSAVSSATYNFPIEVSNIAAFKAANPVTSSTLYKIIGDVTFVFRYNRYIYVKDNSAGLLIYDNSPSTITTEYNEGDIITGGVIGSCTIYNGLYELIPSVNTATGIPGASVTPVAVSMADLLADFFTYESQLIRLENVTFDAGTFGTGAAANINIYQNSSQMVCRNHFGTFTDYTTNPDVPFIVVGFAIPYNDDRQIAPRDLDDIIEIGEIVPVTDIINVPTKAEVGVPLALIGTVIPANATFQTIIWSIKDAGTTGATITGNTLNTTAIGTVVVTATIENGSGFGSNFTKDFSIEVVEEVVFYTITASVNNQSFGAITPSGEVKIEEGGSVTFTITPFGNNKIEDVLVNGVSQGAITAYTFENVTADGTVHAIFGTVGIEKHEFENIHIYSYHNSIYIKNESNVALRSVEIFDMMGRVIYKNFINNSQTAIKLNAENGVYFVRLMLEDGNVMGKRVLVSNY